MSVRPTQRHILSDLKQEQLIYQIFLLSPFEIQQNQQLTTTWKLRVYMYLMLLIYYTLRILFWLQFHDNDAFLQHFSQCGTLWMFVDFFDFIFSALTFGVIVLNGLINNTHQIEFFEQLYHFDEMLFTSFGIPVGRSRTRTTNSCALIIGLAYFSAYFCISLIYIEAPFLTPYQSFALNFTYYFDNVLNLLCALYYIKCTQLCRERLACVRKFLQNYSQLSNEQMNTVLQLFVRIRSQILLINRFMGFVVLVKVTHDFTLCSSIVYLICSSLNSAEGQKDFLDIFLWLGLTIIGTLPLILAADMLMTETNECAEILSSLRIDSMNVSKREWLDKILRLIRFNAPVLNACGLFSIDLRLLFAMCGGIITYVVVLLQLQDFDK